MPNVPIQDSGRRRVDCTTLSIEVCQDFIGNNGNPCQVFLPYFDDGGIANFNELFCDELVTMTDYDCEWDEWSDYDCDCNCSNGAHEGNAADCNNFDGHGDSDCFGPCNNYCKNQNPGKPYKGRTGFGTGRTLRGTQRVKPIKKRYMGNRRKKRG